MPNPTRIDATTAGPTDAALTDATLAEVTRRSAAGAGRRRLTSAAVRFGMLIALVASLITLAILIGPGRQELVAVARAGDGLGPLIAVLGSALLAAAILPRTLLALVGGLMFGWAPGTLYVIIGVTLGATAAFFVGRLLGRDFVERRLHGRLAHLEHAVSSRGALAVFISRLIPLVPFGISNYAFGTTSVSQRSFFLGTLLGIAPATLAYAALGAATAHGDQTGMTIAGVVVLLLGLAGSAGSYLVWRRRPRHAARATA